MHGRIKPAVKEKKEKPTCENQTSEVKWVVKHTFDSWQWCYKHLKSFAERIGQAILVHQGTISVHIISHIFQDFVYRSTLLSFCTSQWRVQFYN